MEVALLTGIGKFEIHQIPAPKIVNDDDVLIRIKSVGVCGSDIHYYKEGRIGSQIVKYPFVIGHEAAGIVEQIGSNVTNIKPGERIAIDPAVSCGKCDQCLAGRENTAGNYFSSAARIKLADAYANTFIPEKCCYPIANKITFDQAVLSEPLAIGIYAVERSMINQNESAAIFGTGPIGMSVLSFLHSKNVKEIFVTDKIEERLEIARKLNPIWSGNPNRFDVVKEIFRIEPLLLDVIFECSGDYNAINQAVQLLKPGGKLVIVGIPDVDKILFPIHELRRKEISIINVRRQVNCTQKAINLLTENQINLDCLITHHFVLEETKNAFDLVANYKDGVMKACITIG